MEVTAKYELIGLMAYPIRHSLSPTMQNCALEKMGRSATWPSRLTMQASPTPSRVFVL